jgi:2-keto-4-pentenoate hydratase/nitrite reductase/ring-hydroxylating ferredoxin subunit
MTMGGGIQVAALAGYLCEVAAAGGQVPPLTDELPDLTLEEGYAIQGALRELHLAGGARLIGVKVEPTDDGPLHGFLTDAMLLPPGALLVLTALAQPRVEAKIAFVLGRDVAGPAVMTAEVLAATEWVAPAVEVTDSRYLNYSFTLPDLVADNAAAGRFLLGSSTSPGGVDLPAVRCSLERAGQLVGNGAESDIADPVATVAALVRDLARAGEGLRAGDVVLSGRLTPSVPLVAGDVVAARFGSLGTVELACRPPDRPEDQATWLVVSDLAALAPGTSTIVPTGDGDVAVFNVGGTLRAIDNYCLHRGGSLGLGCVRDGVVSCPRHGWRYDLATGRRIGTAHIHLACYPVRVADDRVEVYALPSRSGAGGSLQLRRQLLELE